MTFEEFLKGVQPFHGAAIPPEAMAFYQRRYEDLQLKAADDNYFQPAEQAGSDDISNRYEENLEAIFQLDKIPEGAIAFSVRPSFEPERILIIERTQRDYLLSRVVLAENYWLVFYADTSVTDLKKNRSEASLDKSIGDRLVALIDKTIDDARPKMSNTIGLDGIGYTLSRRDGGTLTRVVKHSPDAASRAGRIIAILNRLIDKPDRLGEAMLPELEAGIAALEE